MKRLLSAVMCMFLVFGTVGGSVNCFADENSTTPIEQISTTNTTDTNSTDPGSTGAWDKNSIISIGIVGAVVFVAQIILGFFNNKKTNGLGDQLKVVGDDILTKLTEQITNVVPKEFGPILKAATDVIKPATELLKDTIENPVVK